MPSKKPEPKTPDTMNPALTSSAAAEETRSKLPSSMLMVDEENPDLTMDVALAEQLARHTATMSAEDREKYIADVKRIRAFRKAPFGSFTLKLAVEPIPGYKQHWFNDSPGRVDEAEENGWAHVKDKAAKSQRRVVGYARDGGPLFAYLMKIPMVFWEEDMARRAQIAQDRMDDIKKNPIRAPAGTAQASDRGKFYSPKDEVISIKETLVRTKAA